MQFACNLYVYTFAVNWFLCFSIFSQTAILCIPVYYVFRIQEPCQGKNITDAQYAELATNLKAMEFQFDVSTGTPVDKDLLAQAKDAGRAEMLGGGGQLMISPNTVTESMWKRVTQIIDIIDKVDKEGSKMYDKLNDMKVLSGKGQAMHNELEDCLISESWRSYGYIQSTDTKNKNIQRHLNKFVFVST